MRLKQMLAVVVWMALAAMVACNRTDVPAAQAAGPVTAAPPEAVEVPPPTFTLESGTAVPVRLQETLDTRRNRSGDRFTATLDEPLVSGNRVIVPKGTLFSGHITQAKPSGRFKGRGLMVLTLDSFTLNGQNYPVHVASAARSTGGHKKRNWFWIGGTSGGGAAIGGAAAGGAGALIGAGAGAGAGFIGAVITGKKQVALPVESRVTFRLQTPVQIVS
ncbi:MAG TPA: hypothetical protein VN841_10255 [Bryobacteraceae bacterium]|nr:hypothetical protein [Bryobacteraceae bacterium]